MAFTLSPATVEPSASLTASGTGTKKRPARIRVASTDPTMPNAILAEFTMPASGRFAKSLFAPGGPDRATTLVLQQKRPDGVWAQTASVKLLLVSTGGGGGTTPVPNDPPVPPPTGPDVTAPNFTSLTQGAPTTTEITITADLDEPGTFQIRYGTTTAYGQTTTLESSFLTHHVQTIPSLSPGVTYHWQAVTQDAAGNVRVSSDRQFTTTAVTPVPPGTYPPETSLTWIPTPSEARPGYLAEITQAVTGMKIRRISNVNLRTNAYPKQQPWNADNSRIFLGNGFRMLNATTYADLGDSVRPFGVEYPVWSNVNPDYMYGCSEGANVLKRFSVAGNAWSTRHTFSGKGHLSLGDYEGNISDDDTRIALIYNTLSNQSGTWGVLVYDPVNDVEISSIAIGTGSASHPNNCMISRSGAYVVIQHGAGGTGTSQGTWLYDSATLTRIRQISATRPHADMGKDASSNDIYVHEEGPGGLTSHRLSNGATVDLLPSGTILDAGHVSCTNYDRPGYAYISSNTRSTGSKGSDQMIAVKTDGSQVVEVYALAHAAGDSTYDQAPHMAASRDGSKVLFRSNWDGGDILAYVAGRAT